MKEDRVQLITTEIQRIMNNYKPTNWMSKEIESLTNNYSSKRSLGKDGFTSEFYQICKGLKLIFLTFFPKKSKKNTSKLFYNANISLILKPDKENIREVNNNPISLMNVDAKILNIILAN